MSELLRCPHCGEGFGEEEIFEAAESEGGVGYKDQEISMECCLCDSQFEVVVTHFKLEADFKVVKP